MPNGVGRRQRRIDETLANTVIRHLHFHQVRKMIELTDSLYFRNASFDMRVLFRGNSFSGRLRPGSGNGLVTAVVAFLLVLLALTLQHTFRLNNEIERLHWQLALTQCARSENSCEAPVALKDQPEAVKLLPKDVVSTHVTNAEDTCSEKETFWRWVAGIGLLCGILGCWFLWYYLDAIADHICEWWRGTESEGTKKTQPLSAVIAYEMDLWFSHHKYAKVLALLFFTMVLVIVGSLALFAVREVSLYEAIWGCFAGVGIDWTFSEEWNASEGVSSFVGRLVSMFISLGGLLITALLLGIVSGASAACF